MVTLGLFVESAMARRLTGRATRAQVILSAGQQTGNKRGDLEFLRGLHFAKAFQPFTRCCHSRLRRSWQRDRNTRARGRVQRAVNVTSVEQRAVMR
jgi:hypothetical protein